jgi:exonuclease SbcC
LTDDAKHRSLATLEMQVQAKATGVEQSERRARELAEQAEQLQAQIEELAVPVEDPAQRLDLAHRAEVSATAHRGKLAVAERAAHEIAEHRRAQAGIEERVGQLRGRLAGLPQLADLGEAEHDLNALIETERSTRTLHEGMQARLERARTLTNERAAAVQRAQEAARAVARLTGQAGRWRALEGAFGRDGVPALILESAAIPLIESDANRILADLGVELVVELRTQRALKTEDRLADTLDIIVRDGRGDAPYEDFSGGERTRLNLALRIALARLLAHRRGSEVRLLALDEPEFLDETGMLALARVLSGLAGEFDSIALVSHHPALADAFDQSVRVEKDGDRSRVAALVGT